MSATTISSGLAGRGYLNFGSAGTPPYAERVAHRVAEVERTLAAVAALAGQTGGELAGERVERLLQVLHLVARRVHELDVFGQRLAQRLGHRLGTTVGDEAATDLGLDLLLELLDAVVVLVALEALLERGELAADLLAGWPPSACRACRRDRGSAACGTGSTCRRRAGPAPCRRSAARPAWRAPASSPGRRSCSAFISIFAISSGVSESMPPPAAPLPSPWRICSCISRHISSRSVSSPSTSLYSGPRRLK